MLLTNFGPYGILFTNVCVYYFRFPVITDGKFTNNEQTCRFMKLKMDNMPLAVTPYRFYSEVRTALAPLMQFFFM
jgi:hypothetical protein